MKLFSNLVGIIVLVILVVLSLVDGASFELTTRWVPFFGRFHPVLLHLPIGLFAGVVLLEIYLIMQPDQGVSDKIRFLILGTFYATVFSALFGIFLSWEGGYEAESVRFHKWAGVVTAGLVYVLGWLVKGRDTQAGKLPIAYFGGLIATIVAITITGHKGGNLTHGSNYLTEHNPFGAEVEAVEVNEDTPVFVSHVQPVLNDYCYQCHGEEKIKGELRLDTFESIMAGGVNGPAIEPGNSEGSNMMHAIHLPIDEDEHMPPKGKPQPTSEIINLLAWWIDQGASETARLDELNVTSEVAPHFMEVDVLEFQTREAVDVEIESREESERVTVYYLAQEDFRLGVRGNKATDEDLNPLLPLKANIVELNLAKSEVTDLGLEVVGQMTNLTHLHLNNTSITDSGIEHLSGLYQLEYLNLYGTAVTDKSLQVLQRLKDLKKVFLWETAVTKDAVEELEKSVFDAVQSEKLRLQIQELTKERDSLDVDVVSAFDFEVDTPGVQAQEITDEISISDVMVEFHKGKDSIAAQAREGNADKDDLKRMLESYQAILNLTPPKGTLEDWKLNTSKLIESATGLIEENDGAVEAYKTAVNCKACHTAHRTD